MDLIPLDSVEGRKRLEETIHGSSSSGGSRCAVQLDVVRSFRKQRGNTVCGLASLAVLSTARKRSLARPNHTHRDENGNSANVVVPGLIGKGAALAQDHDTAKTTLEDHSYFVDEDDVYPMVAAAAAAKTTTAATSSGPGMLGVVSETKIRTSGMILDQMRALAQSLPTTEEAIAFAPATYHALPSLGSTEGKGMDGRRATIGGIVDECRSHWHDKIAKETAVASTTTTIAPAAAAATTTAVATRYTLSGPNDLRQLVVEVLLKPPSNEGLVLNYHMSTLGQVPFGGHLSPVAAYHEATDSLLIMDVWHTDTEPVWAPLEGSVWKAIAAIDPESGTPRGILKLVHRTRIAEAAD